MLRREFPQALDDLDCFLAKNFQSDYFVSPQAIDVAAQERLTALTQLRIAAPAAEPKDAIPVPEQGQDLFG